MDAAEIGLREYRETDLATMFVLDEVCFAAEFRFDRESMRAFADARNAVVLIAEKAGGTMAGFVIAHVEPTSTGLRGYVVTLDVAPECRRMRIGERLMRHVERRVFAEGALWMELHVFTGNDGAIRFYERLGYARVAMQQRFYGADGLDGFVYRRELIGL
jgi:[ribosomal protein S18]-alanine N-acetyltransferase